MSRSNNSRRGAVKGRTGDRGCSWGCTICHPEDYREKLEDKAAETDASICYEPADWEVWSSSDDDDLRLWNECVAEARASHRDLEDIYESRLDAWRAQAALALAPRTLRVVLADLVKS